MSPSFKLMGSHIRIYNVDRGWKVQKNILAKNLRWTITDTSLSPDQRYLVYASMSPIVHIVNAGSAETESLANVTVITTNATPPAPTNSINIAIALNATKYYRAIDIKKLDFHDMCQSFLSDVNTVRFADETSHLIYSGSDDSFCKASQQGFKWDTLRALHLLIPEEMDFISFQMVKIKRSNFGTYAKCHPMLPVVLDFHKNTLKVWILHSYLWAKYPKSITIGTGVLNTSWIRIGEVSKSIGIGYVYDMDTNPGYRSYEWDYRWMDYPPQAKDLTHPCDQSVATYRGHSVLRTLIRCYFSPAFSTGQKYIYTGSHHACVYIYDLVSGAQVATLKHHKSPVRDCSWHPFHTTLVSSSWDGDVVKWEFAGSGDTPASSTKKRVWTRHFYEHYL
ncbi:LEC14B protein [Glycine max]|nr:LEC14B protein [Glycine max]